MFRFTMIVSVLCALCFMSAAPSDLEAKCGSGSGRVGLFARPGNRTRLFHRSSSYNRTTIRTSSVTSDAPNVQSATTYIRSRSSGGCPGGVCPINR